MLCRRMVIVTTVGGDGTADEIVNGLDVFANPPASVGCISGKICRPDNAKGPVKRKLPLPSEYNHATDCRQRECGRPDKKYAITSRGDIPGLSRLHRARTGCPKAQRLVLVLSRHVSHFCNASVTRERRKTLAYRHAGSSVSCSRG